MLDFRKKRGKRKEFKWNKWKWYKIIDKAGILSRNWFNWNKRLELYKKDREVVARGGEGRWGELQIAGLYIMA